MEKAHCRDAIHLFEVAGDSNVNEALHECSKVMLAIFAIGIYSYADLAHSLFPKSTAHTSYQTYSPSSAL